MAAFRFTKTAIFNISKVLPYHNNSISFPRHVSRVSFASASNHSQGSHADEGTDNGYNADEAITYEAYEGGKSSDTGKYANDGMREGVDKMKGEAGETVDEKTKQTADTMKDKTKEAADTMKDKTKEAADAMKDKTKEAADTMKDKGYEIKDKTKETAGSATEQMKEKTRKAAETAEDTKDMAKERMHDMKDRTKGAAETVVEKTKQAAEGAWNAAKDTTKKIKETVVGSSSDEDDIIEDHTGRSKPAKVMDEDVMESRRKVGNLDHEKKD